MNPLMEAVRAYQNKFGEDVGLMNVASISNNEIIRRLKNAIDTGETISPNDYTFYQRLPKGVLR